MLEILSIKKNRSHNDSDIGARVTAFLSAHHGGFIIVRLDEESKTTCFYGCETGDIILDKVDDEPILLGESLALQAIGLCAIHGSTEQKEGS